jgi:hypothetical protein
MSDAPLATNTEAKPEVALLDADGRFRPAFVLNFPQDAELNALVALFERGDFRTLNQQAPLLAARTNDAAIKTACEDLVRRTRPDPLVKAFLGIAIALALFLVAWSYLHVH